MEAVVARRIKRLYIFAMRKFLILTLVFSLLLSGCRLKGEKEAVEDFTGVVLDYYKFGDDEKAIQPFIDAYQSTHKGLEIRLTTFDDFEEYERRILNEMAEGEGPDIFSMPNTWFASNYKKLSAMPQPFGLPSDYARIFVDSAYQDLVRVTPDGEEKIFAVPMTVDSLALYYNKDHFEDRLASSGEPAETWEGVQADATLLGVEDSSFGRLAVGAIALGRADNVRYGVETFYLLLLQNGVNFYNENLAEANFGVAAGQDVLEFLTNFADENQQHYSWNQFLADENSEFKEMDAFVSGQVSMFLGFSADYQQVLERIDALKASGIETIAPAAVRIAAVPQMAEPLGADPGKRVAYASYFAEAVSRNSEYADIAWDFLLELTKRENLAQYFDLTHKPTSRRDMLEEQINDPIYGVFAEQAGFAESFPLVDSAKYREIFVDLITQMNDSARPVSIGKVQDEVTSLLPKEGMKFEVKVKELEN